MFKPVVIVYVPKEHIEKFPKGKQCKNQMFDYRFTPTNKDEIWCETKAKSLWYYIDVISQDLISTAQGIIYQHEKNMREDTLKSTYKPKEVSNPCGLKLRITQKRENGLTKTNKILNNDI